MSKAKNIGTRAETAVRNYLLSVGYDPLAAHRNVLKGTADEGDVWLREVVGLIVFEIKGGKMAKEASYGQIQKWMVETETEPGAPSKARRRPIRSGLFDLRNLGPFSGVHASPSFQSEVLNFASFLNECD